VGNIIWNDWRPLPFTFLKEEDVSRLLHWTNKINHKSTAYKTTNRSYKISCLIFSIDVLFASKKDGKQFF